jgi:chitosanase
VLKAAETGTPSGNYSLVTVLADGKNGRRQVTLGIQFDEASGDLGRVLDLYGKDGGRYAQELSRYRSLVDTGDDVSTVLARDDTFKALLREAGGDPVMQAVQDNIFAAETWDPAQRWFNENGFTLPLSMLVISDSFLQSGSMLWFLRQRFKEVPPAKGGREKVFIADYTNHRHLWLSGSGNRAIHNSAYRTRCYLAQINSDNWDLDSLPIVMNGVRVA